MANVYGYVWGIWLWRISDPGSHVDRMRTSITRLPRGKYATGLLLSQGAGDSRRRATQRGVPAQLPVETVRAGSIVHARNAKVVVHQWNGFVPTGSLCSMDSSGLICSPEFCLLQVTTSIGRVVGERLQRWQYVVILAELACELCGLFAKRNTAAGYVMRRSPLTTVSQLAVFIGRMAHEHGVPMMREALAWTLDNLRSPMETVLYLMLCLPRRMGGMQLPRPFGNFRIRVPEALWTKTRLRHIVPDLFWPEFGLIVEFDGQDPHEGHEKEDQERQELAQDMGLKVITFRKEDIRDLRRFNAKAQSVFRHMGLELPPASQEFDMLQKTLRDMLFFHQRWV